MGKYESPDYTVIIRERSFELRKYKNFAVVEYEGSPKTERNTAFRTLFRYIGSDNEENEKIPMTIPVIVEKNTQSRKMAFVVPQRYKNDIPRPKDSNLSIQKFQEGLFATITYSGKNTSSKEQKAMKLLKEWVDKKGYREQSNYMVAVYNGPFTLPFMRRNEVWVRVVD